MCLWILSGPVRLKNVLHTHENTVNFQRRNKLTIVFNKNYGSQLQKRSKSFYDCSFGVPPLPGPPTAPPQKSEYNISGAAAVTCKYVAFTDGEALSVPSVLQFVIAGIKSECLHDIGARPQELSVQLAHWNRGGKIKKQNRACNFIPSHKLLQRCANTVLEGIVPASGYSTVASGVHGPAFT